MSKKFLLIIVAAIFLYLYLNYRFLLSFEILKNNHQNLITIFKNNKLSFIIYFFLIYILITGLSIPGATILTLAGSSVMGFYYSLLIISLAASIGATLSFLLSRYFFKDYILKRFGKQFEIINKGISKDGALYLSSIRLMPIVPFFVINMVMGLTNIKLYKYFFVSYLSMLPGTVIYINAGNNLSKINSMNEIMSFKIITSFIAIGIFPIIVKILLFKTQKNKLK